MKKLLIGLILIFSFVVPVTAFADGIPFHVDKKYDTSAREEISANLIKTTSKLYFYIDDSWWSSQNYQRQQEILARFNVLASEFENNIYPRLTSVFGSEWKPGVDGDERITILFHQMKEDAGGYFRTVDEYIRVQAPESNEREMLYLPTGQIDNAQLKNLLAHEFVHLITFNQKEKIWGVSEEVWLNEARAEYAPVFLGYESIYQGSILERRVKIFLEQPSNSLTEWQNLKYDYGIANLFIRYLVDHYSVSVLFDSLHSKKIGIEGLNEALLQNGFKEDFSQIFTNWTIAVLVNNCSLGQKYCYLSENLKNFRLIPSLNFLPLSGRSSLSVTDVTKNWSGSWQKFIGGSGGVIKLSFGTLAGLNFKIPYLIEDKDGKYSISFLFLDQNQKGEIYISDFGTQNRSLIIIPSLQTKISGFDGNEATYPFTYTVAAVERTPDQEEKLIEEFLIKIDFLKKEIAKVIAQINRILGKNSVSCQQITGNLSLGSSNPQVKCLQEFLKSQPEIYPQGLISGYFGFLTQSAIIRFQGKYSSEILLPSGLIKGTGFVGPATREKINQLLGEYSY